MKIKKKIGIIIVSSRDEGFPVLVCCSDCCSDCCCSCEGDNNVQDPGGGLPWVRPRPHGGIWMAEAIAEAKAKAKVDAKAEAKSPWWKKVSDILPSL